MKHHLSTALFATMLGFAAVAAHAEGECDRYKSAYDQTYCFAKLFVESDKELNEVYKDLTKAIKPGVKTGLKSAELAWMQHRDQECSASGTINVDCNYRLNRERTEYLRDRLRECKTNACRDDAIVGQSWK